MKRVFIDTNVWLRAILVDNPSQSQSAIKLFQAAESGYIKIVTSAIVLLEITYVLKSFYEFTKKQVSDVLKNMLDTRGLYIIEKTNTKKALEYFFKYRIKFSDCLIASQVPEDALLCTFDNDFRKIKELTVASPQEVLEIIAK